MTQGAPNFVGPSESRQFEIELHRDGFDVVEVKTYACAAENPPHRHPFDVRGFVLEGEATITCDGVPGTYRQGDYFEMQAGVCHTEAYGPQGYRWVVGKRSRTADFDR